jgi:hypothetical protein
MIHSVSDNDNSKMLYGRIKMSDSRIYEANLPDDKCKFCGSFNCGGYNCLDGLRNQLAEANERIRQMQEYGCFVPDETGHKCQLAVKNEELKKEIERLKRVLAKNLRKYSHDHDYWHNDCGLCLCDKERYETALKDTNP